MSTLHHMIINALSCYFFVCLLKSLFVFLGFVSSGQQLICHCSGVGLTLWPEVSHWSPNSPNCQQTNTKGQSVGLAPDVARGCKLNENTAPGNLVTGKWYDTLALPGKSVLSALHATFSSQVLGIWNIQMYLQPSSHSGQLKEKNFCEFKKLIWLSLFQFLSFFQKAGQNSSLAKDK